MQTIRGLCDEANYKLAKQLAPAPHLLLAIVPGAGILASYSNLQPKDEANLLDALADKMRERAASLRAAKQSPLILPPGVRANGN